MNMQTFFILAVSLALALGIYAVVVQRGANLMKIDGRTVLMSAIWAALELCAALAGYGIGSWVLGFENAHDRSPFWVHLLAGVIFVAIGADMLRRAFRKKSFLEYRMENIDIREDTLLSLKLCIHGAFAGIACGVLRLGLVKMVVCVFVITALFAVIGYVSGRVWGEEPCRRAYALGGGLLCFLGVLLQILQV